MVLLSANLRSSRRFGLRRGISSIQCFLVVTPVSHQRWFAYGPSAVDSEDIPQPVAISALQCADHRRRLRVLRHGLDQQMKDWTTLAHA